MSNLVKINSINTTVLSMDKKGRLQNAYTPLLNLINSNHQLGAFTSKKLNFDRYTPVDMIVTDEYDGSTNLIINDDKNYPKLINSRFSVLENNTFNIPVHNGNSVTNIYEEDTFDKDTLLLKLYDNIPSLQFIGLSEGGSFKCGSYVFYFKLSDADGNLTNIILESGIILVHIGKPKSKKIRMGLLDENSNKSIRLRLSDIDKGFNYVKVFYERTSSNASLAKVTNYYMINQNFPIIDGVCDMLFTGSEDTLEITKSDILTKFANIQTAKTLTVVDNILFLGNISSHELPFKELQQFAWKILPSVEYSNPVGDISTNNYSFSKGSGYYDAENVYYNTGYWDDEFYRFGIVFIYNNNILSEVYNIQGCDLNEDIEYKDLFKDNNELWEQEPENYFFKDSKKRLNSKGVVRLPKNLNPYKCKEGVFTPSVTKIKFDLSKTTYKTYGELGNEVTLSSSPKEYLKSLGVKGFFFVRLKRIPTIISLGMVIGLTKKDFGSIPVLKNTQGSWITKSFLNAGRMLLNEGSTVVINNSNVETKALLVPDYELREATLNLIFTGQEFLLETIGNITNKISDDLHYANSFSSSPSRIISDVKLTAVPKETKITTDGENYFSTRAGSPQEPFKTKDVNHKWNETAPLDLTASTSLIRGNWGSYVGMSTGDLSYGTIVNIRLNEFKLEDHDLLEYEKRFKDYSLYSAITPRYNIKTLVPSRYKITAARGDCFKSLFTHRMMSNFIDPELPTNTKIIDPGCWAKNYAVRCTAEILATTHSNLTEDTGGWYIPSPKNTKSAIVSLIFGILTCNVGTVVNAISDMVSSSNSTKLNKYANEIVLAFEVYTGKSGSEDGSTYSTFKNDDGTSQYSENSEGIEEFVKKGWIKTVLPKEQELQGGLNLKAIFKSDDKWELHGLASINRADVNAVSFGSWVTFPICSSSNVAMRDISFANATEETQMKKKRAFYPWEDMNIENHLLESGVLNGATSKTISTNQEVQHMLVPYRKQEFFNRIYWSKPNVSENFINSYRIIFNSLYKEYNKEFGAITKLIPLYNLILVVFLHGMGLLPVNKTALSESEVSPWLSSRSVLPALVNTLSSDYGSMWKDSVILTPRGTVYGVDTVAKKIWRYTSNGLEFISDHVITKFLNEWINLSEYDFNEYQGHINVKTHYNEFKNDVIFTYYRDIPMTLHEFGFNLETNSYDVVLIGSTGEFNAEGKWIWTSPEETPDFGEVDLSGNLILEKTIDPKPLIDKWEPGKTWSLCYNEILLKWITFYDWYPVESCNVDNIFFSFDKELIDEIWNSNSKVTTLLDNNENYYSYNKVFMDKMFSDLVKVYVISDQIALSGHKYVSCYYKGSTNPLSEYSANVQLGLNSDWWFTYYNLSEGPATFSGCKDGNKIHVAELRYSDVNTITRNDPVLNYLELRNSKDSYMYLWKHGQAGLYDNQGKIKPTNWYGKLHEFNFEFVVNEQAGMLKIFNNLKLISNKTAPNKFEYEVVGESYDWYKYKPIIAWINNHYKELGTGTTDKDKFESLYKEVLTKTYSQLCTSYEAYNFPQDLWEFENQKIVKLPFLHLETCDRKGRLDKSYHTDTDYWDKLPNTNTIDSKYAFNTSETILVEDEQLNEQRVHTESLGNDVSRYGRIRGNMLYLEDLWDIEIRPIAILWAYIDSDGDIQLSKKFESRHRDKYIKIKVRYTGKDLAVIQLIATMFDYSFA